MSDTKYRALIILYLKLFLLPISSLVSLGVGVRAENLCVDIFVVSRLVAVNDFLTFATY